MVLMHKKRLFFFSLMMGVSVLISCNGPEVPSSSKSANGHFQAVVEIPAGSTEVREYNFNKSEFILPENSSLRFLPFPGNYGFIPGTNHPESDRGTGKALDVLVLSEREELGAVIEIEPLALLKLQRNGKYENKVIAVPIEEEKNILDVKNYFEFQRDHYLCKNILMEWFLHVYQPDTVIFIGWENEKVTRGEIERRKIY